MTAPPSQASTSTDFSAASMDVVSPLTNMSSPFDDTTTEFREAVETQDSLSSVAANLDQNVLTRPAEVQLHIQDAFFTFASAQENNAEHTLALKP